MESEHFGRPLSPWEHLLFYGVITVAAYGLFNLVLFVIGV